MRDEVGDSLLWPMPDKIPRFGPEATVPTAAADQWKSKVQDLLQLHWDALPEALREAVEPSLEPVEVDKKDDPQAITARYKAQSAKLRTLGQRKLQLEAREEKLQQQLQEVQQEVRKVQEEVGTAQKEMEEISSIFAVKVLKPNLMEPEVPPPADVAQSPLVRFQALLAELGDKLTDEQRDELQMLCLGVLQDASNKRPKRNPAEPNNDAPMPEAPPCS